MILIVGHSLVINDIGKTAHVDSFLKKAGSISSVKLPKLSAHIIAHTLVKIYLLVMSLVPPFIMNEACIGANTKPMIHCQEPMVENNSIFEKEMGAYINMSLDVIFSVLKTYAINQEDMSKPDDYDMIFPSSDSPVWNPYENLR